MKNKLFYSIEDIAEEVDLSTRQLRRYLEDAYIHDTTLRPAVFPNQFGQRGARYRWTKDKVTRFLEMLPKLRAARKDA